MATDPYQVAFTSVMERAIFETDRSNKTTYIKAAIEGRGKKEDEVVAARYHQLLYLGSATISSERFKARFSPNIRMCKKSDMEVGIEIADFCAYPIARYILDNNAENIAFDIIRNKIRSNNNGSIIGYGIKIFP